MREIRLGIYRHAVMMHGIAQLAIFAYRSMVRYSRCYSVAAVIVRIYSPLTCYKANHNDPAVNNMALIFFHCQLYAALVLKRFAQKYSNPRSNCHCLVTMSL
jgi:hypothetical protein